MSEIICMSQHAEKIIDLYRRHAQAWIAARGHSGPVIETAWLKRFCALLPDGGEILDLGCGSGEPMARTLADRGFRVTGVDSSQPLLDAFASCVANAETVLADMRILALGRTFDGILAWHSSFHLTPDDQRRMMPIFADHASPGTALMFTSGPGYGENLGAFQGEPLYHGSLGAEDYRRLLDAHGFDLLDHIISDPDCGSATVWLAQKRA